jgi:predicted CopG family antitoxin
MGKLKIVVNNKTKDSITRTIRMSGDSYDKISAIAEKKEISFNNVINQLIEYGLENLDEEE